MNKQEIIDTMVAYATHYGIELSTIVVGSGAALVLHDCAWRTEAEDIDITLLPQDITRLKRRFTVHLFTRGNGKTVQVFGSDKFPVDAHYPDKPEDAFYTVDTTSMFGFQVLTLDSLLEFKKGLGRPKDQADITGLTGMLTAQIGEFPLYHYATHKYAALATLQHQQVNKDKWPEYTAYAQKSGSPFPYHQHISLTLMPIDPLHMSSYYPGHPFWAPGAKLYQHIVLVRNIDFTAYQFVETPYCVSRMDATHWDDNTDLLKYKRSVHAAQRELGEIGSDVLEFGRQIRRLAPLVQPALERVRVRHDWEEIKTKYAATVPHVMVAPRKGVIVVRQVNLITLR